MANVIGMAQKSAILGLWRREWSCRRISRELGLNRRTVARYIELHDAEERKKGGADSKCTIVPAGKLGRQSQCSAYSEQIKLELTKGLTAQRIWQDLVVDYGYEGSYDSVKRYVRKEKGKSPRRIFRMEVLPGEDVTHFFLIVNITEQIS